MNFGIYASFELVKQYHRFTETTDDKLLRRFTRQASALFDRGTRRWFYPLQRTRTYDYRQAYRLWLVNDLLEVTTLTNGDDDVLTEDTDFISYPLEGPPYHWLDIKTDSGELFQFDSTLQAQITLDGIWGRHDDWDNAWQDSQDALTADVTATATSLSVTNAAGTDLWGETPRFMADTLLKIDSEWLWATAKDTSGNTLTVIRAANGSTAATHSSAATIYVYQPPADVVEAIIHWTSYLYARKDTDEYVVTEYGTKRTPEGVPQSVQDTIDKLIKRNYRQ